MQDIRKHLARREVFDVGKEKGAEGESLEGGKQGPMEPVPALFSSVRQPALRVLSTGGLFFPGLSSHGCALQPVLPTQADVCAGWQ